MRFENGHWEIPAEVGGTTIIFKCKRFWSLKALQWFIIRRCILKLIGKYPQINFRNMREISQKPRVNWNSIFVSFTAHPRFFESSQFLVEYAPLLLEFWKRFSRGSPPLRNKNETFNDKFSWKFAASGWIPLFKCFIKIRIFYDVGKRVGKVGGTRRWLR